MMQGTFASEQTVHRTEQGVKDPGKAHCCTHLLTVLLSTDLPMEFGQTLEHIYSLLSGTV